MAKRPTVRLNPPSPELQKVLTETSKPALKAAADAVAAGVKAPTNVSVFNNKEGRAVAVVTIIHPKGLAMQAKHGELTRAAAAQGLEVKRYRV
ncbi:hypothetical protein [Ancrocorticia populi]|uniref:hypothetical protein n=1 Tax=Ancrocorticia populi TaxID=2175228 RepID=UPI003F9A75A0